MQSCSFNIVDISKASFLFLKFIILLLQGFSSQAGLSAEMVEWRKNATRRLRNDHDPEFPSHLLGVPRPQTPVPLEQEYLGSQLSLAHGSRVSSGVGSSSFLMMQESKSDYDESESSEEDEASIDSPDAVATEVLSLPTLKHDRLPASASPHLRPSLFSGGHLGAPNAASSPRNDPSWVEEGLPKLAPLREDSCLSKAHLNVGASGNGFSIQVDAGFVYMSNKSLGGGFRHFDEPKAPDLSKHLQDLNKDNSLLRWHDNTLFSVDQLASQLEGVVTMSFHPAFSTGEVLVLRTIVQETFWRLAQYTDTITHLVESLTDNSSGLEKKSTNWGPLESSLKGFCSEISLVWSSLGVQVTVSSDGSVQWAHTSVTEHRWSSLFNGTLVLLATVHSSVARLHLPSHLQPLLDSAQSSSDSEYQEPVLDFFLPAPAFEKSLSVVLGLETPAESTARLSALQAVMPTDPILCAGRRGWAWKTAGGSKDPYLGSVWRNNGFFMFQSNKKLCLNSPLWLVAHSTWAFQNISAKVGQIQLAPSGFYRLFSGVPSVELGRCKSF